MSVAPTDQRCQEEQEDVTYFEVIKLFKVELEAPVSQVVTW